MAITDFIDGPLPPGTGFLARKLLTGTEERPGPEADEVHNNPWAAEEEGGCFCWKDDDCEHGPWLCGLVLCDTCNGSGVIVEVKRVKEVEVVGYDDDGNEVYEERCVEYDRRVACYAGCDLGLVPWHESGAADGDYHYAGLSHYERFSYAPPDDAGPSPEEVVHDEC